MDDFGVKYVGKENVEHLMEVLKQHYQIEEDWEGSKYCGVDLDWDYIKRKVHLSMDGYVEEALQRFRWALPKKPQHQPHAHVAPKYGATVQYAKEEDTADPATKEEKKYIQQVLGTFLYYARMVDGTMLVALSAIASEQATPTKNTLKKIAQFLDYAATNPDAVLTYHRSDMILNVESDASYLSERNARSRAGGHFYMSDNSVNPKNN